MRGVSKHACGIPSSKDRPPDRVLCVSPTSSCRCVREKKRKTPLPLSYHREDLEVCLLALIPRARLAVTQACSRHDSHCGICSLCLRDKAASVVSPASCFKHHMVALWRSPSSHPPLFLHRSNPASPQRLSAPKQFPTVILDVLLSLLAPPALPTTKMTMLKNVATQEY